MNRHLLRLIEQFSSKRVLVLGDAMLDSYVLGASTRQCQEAPAPVVAVHERRDCPGGAANTAVNLAALGCRVELLSVVGADHEGERLRALLRQHDVGTYLLTSSETRQTLSKQRIVNGDQLLARVDQGDTGPISRHVEQRVLRQLDEAFAQADAIVISDYGYGILTAAVLGRLRRLQARFRQLVAVDARDLARYRTIGVTVVKPNYGEALRLAQVVVPPAAVPRAQLAVTLGPRVLDLSGADIAAITLDADGAVVVERGHPPYRTLTAPAEQARTAGAGDTYLAAFALTLASDGSSQEAAEIAACAASVVVSYDGTSVCSGRDLWDLLATKAGGSSALRRRPAIAEAPPKSTDSGEGDVEHNPTDVGYGREAAVHQT